MYSFFLISVRNGERIKQFGSDGRLYYMSMQELNYITNVKNDG